MTVPPKTSSEQPKSPVALDQSLDNISRPRGSRPDAHVQPQYLVIVDANRRYVDVSESFCKLLGYQFAERPQIWSKYVWAGTYHNVICTEFLDRPEFITGMP
jgi:PAS domain-containing protein